MRPPRITERVLMLLCRGQAGDDLAGDLAEEFRLLIPERGVRKARRWYRSQVARSVMARVALRIAGGAAAVRDEGLSMSGIWTDIRCGLRALSGRPALTAAAVTALALGLCAQAAIFAVVDAVLLRPLPYDEPGRLVTLRQLDRQGSDESGRVSPATFLEWRELAASLNGAAAVRPWTFTWRTDTESRELPAGLVSQGFFDMLGVRPAQGRLLAPADYQPGAPRAVVIADRLWADLFGRDPRVLGRPLRMGDQSVTVIGVLPASFWWMDGRQVMWGAYPLGNAARQQRPSRFITAVGRLAPGRSVGDASGEVSELARRLAVLDARVYGGVQFRVTSAHDEVTASVRPVILLLVAAVTLLCLIAFANYASLMLVRGAERQVELQIRAALGAGRLRIARQLLVENCLLASFGVTMGLVAGHWVLQLMVSLTPVDVPRLASAAIDLRTVLTSALIAGSVAVAVGIVPTLWFMHRPSVLRGATWQVSRRGSAFTRRWLVASQVGLTFLLLVGAGLLSRSFVRLIHVDPGFSAHRVALVELHVWSAYPQPVQQVDFFARLLRAVAEVPGVVATGATSAPPFLGGPSIEIETTVETVGYPERARQPVWLTIATPGYFETLRIPVRQGRSFSDRDRSGSPRVALVSERVASRFPNGEAIGQMITVGNERTPEPLEVIGVVGNLRHVALDGDARDDVYVPLAQAPFGSMNLVVRTEGSPSAITPVLVAALQNLNPTQQVAAVRELEVLVDATTAPRRFALVLVAWLAAAALILAAIGLYGLISLITAQRTREIGLRIALGGDRGHVLGLVVRSAVGPPLAGLVAGAALALVSTRLIQARLFDTDAADPVIFAGAAGLMLAVAALAAVIPAQRALRVNPVESLRNEP